MSLAALSETNVGDITFHLNCEDIPVFHPNLILLFSRCILEENCTHLTLEQQRLWHRYLYAYDPNDWMLKCLDSFLGSFYTAGNVWNNPWVQLLLHLPIASKTNLGIMEVGDGLNVYKGHVDVDLDYIANEVVKRLPVASKTQRGIAQIGDNIDVNDGLISVANASKTRAGVMKVGDNLEVSGNTVSVPNASKTKAGVTKIGNNIDVTSDGAISIPVATDHSLGVAMGGDNITVTNGRFDATGGGGPVPPPYELPLMTHTIRGGAKLRDGTTLGDVELDSEEGMFVDTTEIDNTMKNLDERIKKLEEELPDA